METHLARIIEYLRENFGAKAIFLVGSRCVGDFHEGSDWDFFVFTDLLSEGDDRIVVNENKGFPVVGKEKIDCFWLSVSQNFDFDVFGPKLRYAKIVLDEDDIAANVLRDAEKFYALGPNKWTKAKFDLEYNRSFDYLRKMKYLLENGEDERLFYRICFYFVEYSLNWWFGMRGEWPLRSQEAYKHIEKEDPEFYLGLRLIATGKTLREKVYGCERIHDVLFEKNRT